MSEVEADYLPAPVTHYWLDQLNRTLGPKCPLWQSKHRSFCSTYARVSVCGQTVKKDSISNCIWVNKTSVTLWFRLNRHKDYHEVQRIPFISLPNPVSHMLIHTLQVFRGFQRIRYLMLTHFCGAWSVCHSPQAVLILVIMSLSVVAELIVDHC